MLKTVEMDAHALCFSSRRRASVGIGCPRYGGLGDLAGYEEGRFRSDRFGLTSCAESTLQAGMLVIEPGFYQVLAILNDAERRSKYQGFGWERLARFWMCAAFGLKMMC